MDSTAEKPLSHRSKKSGSETRQKEYIIGFRAQADDRTKLKGEAAERGLTLSSYVRETMLHAPKTRSRRRPLVDVAALSRTLGQLNRVGGNINQVARAINLGETPLAHEIHDALAGINDVLAAIRAAMGLGVK